MLWAGECQRHLVIRLLFGKTDGDLAALAMQELTRLRRREGDWTVKTEAALEAPRAKCLDCPYGGGCDLGYLHA